MADEVLCPHCKDVEMEYQKAENETHVYICPECPNVMFEFMNAKNTLGLHRLLESRR